MFSHTSLIRIYNIWYILGYNVDFVLLYFMKPWGELLFRGLHINGKFMLHNMGFL